jgi:hypothetical protein
MLLPIIAMNAHGQHVPASVTSACIHAVAHKIIGQHPHDVRLEATGHQMTINIGTGYSMGSVPHGVDKLRSPSCGGSPQWNRETFSRGTEGDRTNY